MNGRSGFLVLILIASGCLSKACGDGQISASPRSSEGAPASDQPNVDEPASDQPNVDEPASGVTGVPYGHVTPADIGVSIGPGVIGAYPTEAYTGSCTPSAGTTIENKVITCDTLRIFENDITIRNSIINVTTYVGVKVGEGGGTEATGLTIEYSLLDHQVENGKTFQAFNGSGNGDYRNMTIRKNQVKGAHDVFYIEGNFDGFLVENNVFGPLGAGDDADYHADGFQMAEKAGISGSMVIRGNYWDPQSLVTKTAILFATGTPQTNTSTIVFENNRVTTWGSYTLWCADADSCTIRYNIYDAAWEAQAGNRCGGSQCTGGGGTAYPCCGYPIEAVKYDNGGVGEYTCNRYESDGRFIEQQWVSGITHMTTGCPAYTPR